MCWYHDFDREDCFVLTQILPAFISVNNLASVSGTERSYEGRKLRACLLSVSYSLSNSKSPSEPRNSPMPQFLFDLARLSIYVKT